MSHKKKILSSLALVGLLLTLSACHRDCVCQGYDGSSHTYTEEEVDAHNVTCANMIYQANEQFYAVCNWE